MSEPRQRPDTELPEMTVAVTLVLTPDFESLPEHVRADDWMARGLYAMLARAAGWELEVTDRRVGRKRRLAVVK